MQKGIVCVCVSTHTHTHIETHPRVCVCVCVWYIVFISTVVAGILPAKEHGDAAAEDVEPGSLFLDEQTASAAEWSERRIPVTESGTLFLLHSHIWSIGLLACEGYDMMGVNDGVNGWWRVKGRYGRWKEIYRERFLWVFGDGEERCSLL